VKGLFLCANGYINAQDNPKDPKGTIISMTSGTAGITYPLSSGYSVSKLAVQKFSEFVDGGVFP
jgi:short-subunit dehydrogenase